MTKSLFRKAEVSPFYILCGLLVLVFCTGGSARADVASLAVLRPGAAMALGWGLLTLRREQVRQYQQWFVLLALTTALVVLHLVPLPFSVWSSLPGHMLLADIDRAAGIGEIWRPLSMVPIQTENALFSLLVPAAVLVLAVQLNDDDLARLVPVVLALGLLSGFLGVLQAIGSNRALYFYRVTNFGSAVGLFANRNHQALLLAVLLPMLAVFASMRARSSQQARLREWLCIGLALVLIPLILITGSRAGVVLGVFALMSIPFVYRAKRSGTAGRGGKRARWPVVAVIAVALLTVVSAAIMLSRSEALDRLVSADQLEADRGQFWPIVLHLGREYLPFGSGIGSFVEVYQIAEPDKLLGPQYLNHAHNDWLEIFLTGGIPAVLLVLYGLVALLGAMKSLLWQRELQGSARSVARLAATIVSLILLSSFVDYPLRTPIISAIFVIAVIWLSRFSPQRS